MRIIETFKGISGEVCAAGQGSLTYFIRLAGCNLRCRWCDTVWGQNPHQGERLSPGQVDIRIAQSKANHVLFTGGEPLLQIEQLVQILEILSNANRPKPHHVTIETNGSIPFQKERFLEVINSHLKLSIVADYKLPSSGQLFKMVPLDEFRSLDEQDYVKFVIADHLDLSTAISVLRQIPNRKFTPAFSPMIQSKLTEINPQEIIDRLWAEEVHDALVNVQIHKFLNVK